MLSKNQNNIFSFDPKNKPLVIFYSFFIIPSLIAVCGWMLYNARGSLGDGSGNSFPLLFQTNELFTDWLIPHTWSTLKNPWAYVGSPFENILPPSLYGPTIFMFYKLLPGGVDKNIYDILSHVSAVFMIILVCWFLLLKVGSFISNGANENFAILSIFLFFLSYPVFFAVNRGNSSIISYLYLSLFLFFCITRFNSYIWIAFLNLYAFSSIQLFPLLFISTLAFFRIKGIKSKIPFILSFIPVMAYVLNSGVTLSQLKSTYLIQVNMVRGWGGIYNHDIQSSLIMFGGNKTLIIPFIFISLLIPIFLIKSYLKRNRDSEDNYNFFKDIFSLFDLEKVHNVTFLVFAWSATSLIISYPSADYHLLRVLPFIYLVLNIIFSRDFNKLKIPKIILFSNLASAGILISYLKLWTVFDFINVQDMSVPIRAFSLIIWIATIFYCFAIYKRQLISNP